MAKPLRVEYPGAWYHVAARGNAGTRTNSRLNELEGYAFDDSWPNSTSGFTLRFADQ